MPYNKSIKWKIVFIFLFVILLTVTMFEVIITLGIKTYYYTNIEQSLIDRINLNMSVYDTYIGNSSFNYKAKYILEKSSIPKYLEAQIIDTSGNIMETTSQFSKRRSVSTADVEKALEGYVYTYTGKDAQTDEEIMAISTPLYDKNDIVGVIRYVTSIERVSEKVRLYNMYFYAVGILIVIISFVISYLFANRIVKPIYSLKSSADRIAEGHWDIKANKYSDDEIGELIDTFNYMVDEIKKVNKLKHDFISSISHELRTPLTSVKGWSETLLSGDLTDIEETRMVLEIISKESVRLSELVENLLDFSKLQANRMKLNIQNIEIISLVKRVVNQMQVLLKEKNIECTSDFFADRFMYRCDINKLKQILIIIFDNAIKHTFFDGKIDISVKSDDDYLIFEMQDNGEGIEEEHIKNVMKGFYKANYNKAGSGLGLSIANKIVNLHGGEILIESEHTVGTKVTIRLPLKYTLLEELE